MSPASAGGLFPAKPPGKASPHACWEDALEKELATHSGTLAWKISWTEQPGGLQSMGSQRVGHDLATSLFFSFFSLHNPCRAPEGMERPWSPWTLRFSPPSKMQTRCREQIPRAWPTGVAATLMWLEARSNARRSVDGPSSANGHAIPAHRGGCRVGGGTPCEGPAHLPVTRLAKAIRRRSGPTSPCQPSPGARGQCRNLQSPSTACPQGSGSGGFPSRPRPS